jgi:diaminopimelate epimerase
MSTIHLITAAGGNGTAIEVLDLELARHEYEERGQRLGKDMEARGAEQAGFLIPSAMHFEMAGGEFCGNATRAAAVLLSDILGKSELSFTVSGFDGTVAAEVSKTGDDTYFVRCTFPGLPTTRKEVTLPDGSTAAMIDLSGIVHVVIEGAFPADRSAYESQHRTIMEGLGLTDRGAVGVIWFERKGDSAVMHPVVWVRAVDTFFYEESCGSGTIALAKVTGLPTIIQPSGQGIDATIGGDAVILQSEMEVAHVTVPA